MPLFNNNNKYLEETTLNEDLDRLQGPFNANDFKGIGIDYIKETKKKIGKDKDKYILYLERELEMCLTALHRSIRFANALDVAKAEKSKKI